MQPVYSTPGPNVLTVVNGSGCDTHAGGDSVTIAAQTPPARFTFSHWQGSAGVTFQDANSQQTILTMPAGDARATAAYGSSVNYVEGWEVLGQ